MTQDHSFLPRNRFLLENEVNLNGNQHKMDILPKENQKNNEPPLKSASKTARRIFPLQCGRFRNPHQVHKDQNYIADIWALRPSNGSEYWSQNRCHKHPNPRVALCLNLWPVTGRLSGPSPGQSLKMFLIEEVHLLQSVIEYMDRSGSVGTLQGT
jgi:hypothetical protein